MPPLPSTGFTTAQVSLWEPKAARKGFERYASMESYLPKIDRRVVDVANVANAPESIADNGRHGEGSICCDSLS